MGREGEHINHIHEDNIRGNRGVVGGGQVYIKAPATSPSNIPTVRSN